MAGPTVVSTEYGYYISCTGGTGNVQILSDPKMTLKVCGIACGGTSSADIVTVYNGSAVPVFAGVGSTAAASNALAFAQLASTIRIIGPNVTFLGGTSGQCFIYCPSANY